MNSKIHKKEKKGLNSQGLYYDQIKIRGINFANIYNK